MGLMIEAKDLLDRIKTEYPEMAKVEIVQAGGNMSAIRTSEKGACTDR
jgi:hypothetical protein